LAIAELKKPMRWACDHVTCDHCGIYEERPQTCRDFNCAWLSGNIPGDESLRPDRLGVLFDFFHSMATNKARFVAFELWNGAFDEPTAAALLREIAANRELDLSYRDGTWRTIGTTGQFKP
jgi:Fe-S-cluster containining protein